MKIVTVVDVYNKNHRIDIDQYNNTDRVQLPRYNQFGKRISQSASYDPMKHASTIHRGNIARILVKDADKPGVKYLEVRPIIYT